MVQRFRQGGTGNALIQMTMNTNWREGYDYPSDDDAKALPHVRFYSYTKSIPLFLNRTMPSNYDIIYSEGGTRDDLIDYDKHRHCRIFDTEDSLNEAGYVNAMKSDVMATKWFNDSDRVGLVMH